MGKIKMTVLHILLLILTACDKQEDVLIDDVESIVESRMNMMNFMREKYGRTFTIVTDEIKDNGVSETYHVIFDFPDSSCQFSASMIIGGIIWDDYNACVRIDEIEHMFDDALLGKTYIDEFEVYFDPLPTSDKIPIDSELTFSEFLLETSYQVRLEIYMNDYPMNDELAERIRDIASQIITTSTQILLSIKVDGEYIYSVNLPKEASIRTENFTTEVITQSLGKYSDGVFCVIIDDICQWPVSEDAH